MGKIQPNPRGKLAQSQKQLTGLLREMEGMDKLSTGQQDKVIRQVLIALTRIQLAELGRIEDLDT